MIMASSTATTTMQSRCFGHRSGAAGAAHAHAGTLTALRTHASSAQDADVENAYYSSKGQAEGGDLDEALQGFRSVLKLEGDKGEW